MVGPQGWLVILEVALVVTTWERKRCYWHLVSGGQGRRSASYSTRESPRARNYLPENVYRGDSALEADSEARIQAQAVHLRGVPGHPIGEWEARQGREGTRSSHQARHPPWATVVQSHWGTLESSEERGPQSYPSRGLRGLDCLSTNPTSHRGNPACRGH